MIDERHLTTCRCCGFTIWRTRPCPYCAAFRTRDDQLEYTETP